VKKLIKKMITNATTLRRDDGDDWEKEELKNGGS
jgi:hypothetical protein